MKKTRIAAAVLFLCAGLLLPFSSCGRNKTPAAEPLVLDTAIAGTESPLQEQTPAEKAAPPVPDGKKISAARALKIYKKAVGGLKARRPGFTRLQWQSFGDITTADPTGVVSGVLTILSDYLVRNGSEAEARANPEIVAKGDGAAAVEKLPLFRSSAEYAETEHREFISDAVYVKHSDYKEYWIFFAPERNPVSGGLGMGSLMSPFDRASIPDTVGDLIRSIKKDDLQIECVYSGCYLMFRTDKNGRLIRIENHMSAQIDARAEIDLVFASAEILNGSCRYEEHYVFTDFEYEA